MLSSDKKCLFVGNKKELLFPWDFVGTCWPYLLELRPRVYINHKISSPVFRGERMNVDERSCDEISNTIQCNVSSWVVSQPSDWHFMEDNPPDSAVQPSNQILLKPHPTFASAVDLLSQNLLLLVQLLQLSRVQHLAVHLRKITVSFIFLPTSLISAYLEDSLSWDTLLSQHDILLWDGHDNNNTVSIQHHHLITIEVSPPQPPVDVVVSSSNQVGGWTIQWWQVLCEVCTALWPGQ